MSKMEPVIQKFMSYLPQSIDSEKTLAEAQRLMSDHKIRHLPVMKNGKVFGILSERDIKTAVGLVGADPLKLKAGDVCHGDPYRVEPMTPLHEVTDTMAEHHYGCALIVQNEKLVGIFTTVDACKAISEILQQRFHSQ